MLSKAFQSFLLSVITISAIHSGKVVNAQSPLPSCTSLSVASKLDCTFDCINKGETLASFSDDNGVVECGCSTSKVCVDVDAPLPSCASLGVSNLAFCINECIIKGEMSGDFREDNGVVECTCSTSKVCEVVYEDVNAPLPSCTSLRVASKFDCTSACINKGETFASFSDVNDVECACTASRVCGGDDEDVNASLPSCTSLRVASKFDCDNACLIIPGVNSASFSDDNGVECACSAFKLCYDDVNAPLPSCTSLGVASKFDCTIACASNKGEISTFWGATNGVFDCDCSTSKLCGDGDFVRSAAGGRTVVVATILCLSAMTLMV